MELADISELDLGSNSSYETTTLQESEQKNMGTQRISVSDHINAYHYSAEKVDSFVIDMDSFSTSSINKDSTTNANSRTTLQRSLSRKGSQRCGDRNVNGNGTLHDRDNVPTTTCSPKAASCKSKGLAVGSTQNPSSPTIHHQITVTAGNICTTPTTAENKCITRRSSFGRSSSWLLDPKKVVIVFATLSSMGTLLLIFLTLAISKQTAVEYGGDLQ